MTRRIYFPIKEYQVYILTNFEKTVLYTDVTNNLSRRLYEHKARINKNSFTSKYKCYYLLYFDNFVSIEQAIDREKQIKGWRQDLKKKS